MNTAAPTSQASPIRAAPEDKRKRYELLQDCRDLVISRLSSVVGEALAKMSDELSGVALKSKDPDEQRALMDAVTVVRQHRTEIELRFRRAFSDVFERRMFNPDASSQQAAATGELALVDDAELQAKLEVDRLVGRARGRLDPDEVLGVRARFGALLERDWFDESRHPASPEAIFEALKSALGELAPAAPVQNALLDAFEPHVSANLNAVYSTVNERLKAGNVLPKLRPQVAVRVDHTRPAADRIRASVEPDERALDQLAGEVASGAPASGGQFGAAQGHAGPQAGAGVQGAAGAQPGPGARGALGAGFAAGAAPIASVAAQHVDMVLQQLSSGVPGGRESATRMLSNPDLFALADLPIPAAKQPLIEALGDLQASSAAAPEMPPQVLVDVAARAQEKGSALDQLTVEIVSMVFDYIYADKRIADVIKQQLLRLQVVAIKAALIDRSFFARRAHPMRRLIERITDVGADADADLSSGSQLVKGVEDVVEWVLLNFKEDLQTFDDARVRIDALAADEAARRAERIALVTREAEHRESVQHARGLAMARLADRLDPDTTPFVREFLREWWSLVLAEAQVTGANAAIQFDDGMAVGEALIWSVAPKAPEEVQRLASMLPKLINGLMRGVKMVSMPDDLRENFFNDLLKAHTRAIDAAKHTTASTRKPSNLRMRSDGRIQFTPVMPPTESVNVDPQTIEARSVLLGELRRGDAVEVDVEGHGEFRVFKLSWVSPAQRLYILSRFPEGAMQLDRSQLAALFDVGRARLGDRGSALDRAIESVAAESPPTGTRTQT